MLTKKCPGSMMHCGQARMYSLNIEFVHLGACLGFIHDIFIEALMSHPHLSLQRKVALVRAIGKIIWIQNDLFAKWYVRDGQEFMDEMSDVEIEREGFVDGKRVLGDGSSTGRSSSEDDRSSTNSTNPSVNSASACPFADVAKPAVETKIWSQ